MNRPALVKFAKHMETALKENDHKGKTGWKKWDHTFMVMLLQKEVFELVVALSKDSSDKYKNNGDNIRKECCDIANFAMMIFDNEGDK